MKRLLLSLCLLAAVACEDHHARYEKQFKKYEALVDAHTPPSNEAYVEISKELSKIPPDDAAYPSAKKLIDAIAAARAPLPARPLAVAANDSPDPLMVKRAQCAQLAMALGASSDAGREDARVKLAACREELERLDAAQAHADDPQTPHAEVHLADGGVTETLRIECAQWRAQLNAPNADRERVLKSLQLNADKLKMLDAPAGPCAYDGH